MVVKFGFEYEGRRFNLKVKEVRDIFSQMTGLMFKKNSPPLLFVFKNTKKRAIHSFFCRPFIAIWFAEGKIVDVKTIRKWRLNIYPKEKFDRLLEIPLFVDEEKV